MAEAHAWKTAQHSHHHSVALLQPSGSGGAVSAMPFGRSQCSHARRDNDRKDNSPENRLRRKFNVGRTCNTFGSGGSIKVAGRGEWSEQCPSRDIFYTLAPH